MPKIYRVMNGADSRPTVGDGPLDLGVRVPRDIQPDVHGDVLPNSGGMSVSPRMTALPPHRIPKRLRPLVPKATGKDFHFVWSMGEGPFVADVSAPGLRLRPDPANSKHGFVEPEAVMPIGDYRQSLEATQAKWRVDELGGVT